MTEEHASAILKLSGYRAVIEPDRWVPGSFTLIVDGTPQSHVNLENPAELFFEYIQRIGHVIDQLGMPGEPITAVHLGAGAFTLPRYIEATRPGSRQQVVEIETDLVELVRAHLPLPRNASIRVRHGDAREVLGKFPPGLRGEVDLLVVDVFSGSRTPAHVTSLEFYTEAISLLKPGGVIVANVADGPGLAFARGQAATLLSAVSEGSRGAVAAGAAGAAGGHVAALAETQILKGATVRQCRARRFPPDATPRLDAAASRWWSAPVEGGDGCRVAQLDRWCVDRHRRHRRAVTSSLEEHLPDRQPGLSTRETCGRGAGGTAGRGWCGARGVSGLGSVTRPGWGWRFRVIRNADLQSFWGLSFATSPPQPTLSRECVRQAVKSDIRARDSG